jgi:hypothetical protein
MPGARCRKAAASGNQLLQVDGRAGGAGIDLQAADARQHVRRHVAAVGQDDACGAELAHIVPAVDDDRIVGARDQLVAQLEQGGSRNVLARAFVGALHGAQGVVLVGGQFGVGAQRRQPLLVADELHAGLGFSMARNRSTHSPTTRPMPAGMNLGSVPSCATTFSTVGADRTGVPSKAHSSVSPQRNPMDNITFEFVLQRKYGQCRLAGRGLLRAGRAHLR